MTMNCVRPGVDSVRVRVTLAVGVETVVEGYLAHLRVKRGRGRSADHIAEVNRRVRRMLEGVAALEDVTPQSIEERMVDLLQEVVRIRGVWRNRKTQTIDGHRRELGTFFRWAKWAGHVKRNPVRKVERWDSEDASWSSRPFSPAEADAFFAALDDEERRLVYLTWATTGLRPDETERTRTRQLELAPLDDPVPYLRVLRATSKNHKAVKQPLHPIVVAKLLARPPRAPDAPLFDHVPTCEEFLEDLKRAGLYEQRVRAEGTLSRTSLRKSFATNLDRLGATEGQAQKLMRHSRPELTRNIYTHHELAEKAAIVARLSFPPERSPA